MATESLPVSGGIAFTNFITNPDYTTTISSVSSESNFYDADNLLVESRSKRWRSVGDGTSQVTFYFDGTSVLPTFLALVDSNLADDKTFILKGATDAAITTSVDTYTLTSHAQSNNKVIRWYLGNPDSGTATAKPYWQITFPSYTTTEGYHTVGTVWIGTYLGFRPSSVGMTNINDSIRSTAYGGTVYSDIRNVYRDISVSDDLLTFDEAYALANALNSQTDRPVIVDLHGTATTDALEKESAYYARVDSSSLSLTSSVQNSVNMRFVEIRS